MRPERNNTRRVGGLLLDMLMLAFIFSVSSSDIKIVDTDAEQVLTIRAAPDDHFVFRDFDSLLGSFLKHISKIDFIPAETGTGITLCCFNSGEGVTRSNSNTQYLYNTFYTNTTINAP